MAIPVGKIILFILPDIGSKNFGCFEDYLNSMIMKYCWTMELTIETLNVRRPQKCYYNLNEIHAEPVIYERNP